MSARPASSPTGPRPDADAPAQPWRGLRAIFALPDAALADRAVAAAVPFASVGERGRLIDTLMDRGGPAAAVLAVRYLHERAEAHRPALITRLLANDHLDAAVRSALTGRGEQAAGNALDLVVQGRLGRLAYLLPEAARHGGPAIHQAAGEALDRLAQAVAAGGGDRAELAAVVEQMVVRYGRQPSEPVLTAFCRLVPRGLPEALAALSDPEHAALPPLRRLLADATDPAVRGALLAVLSVPTLHAPACAGLQAAMAAGAVDEVLAPDWLLADPSVAAAVGRCQPAEGLIPAEAMIAGATAASRRAWCSFAGMLALSPGRRWKLLAMRLSDPDAGTRLSALRQVGRLVFTEPTHDAERRAALAERTHDDDPAVARLALRMLEKAGDAGLSAVAGVLMHSPHAEVREAVGRRLGPALFDRWWKRWPALDPQQRQTTGRAVAKLDPGFLNRLRAHLRNAAPDAAQDRQRAVQIVATLKLAELVETELLTLADDADARLVAGIATALGEVADARADAALGKLLNHPDERVRANAVEALDARRAAAQVATLLTMTGPQEGPRPRANAIGALLAMTVEQALPALRRMVTDPRPQHRRSALWLVRQTGLADVVMEAYAAAGQTPPAPHLDATWLHPLLDPAPPKRDAA